MRSNERKPKSGERQIRVMRPLRGGGAGDAASEQIARVAGKVGNQQLDDRVKQSSNMRDELLKFIGSRLKTLHGVQEKERSEIKDQRQWYKLVARGKGDYFLPDTTRWHEAAQLYKRAAETMANGNLGQGAQLLEKAMEAEQAAYDSMPRQVRDELDEEEKKTAAAPREAPHAISAGACPITALPADIHKYADRILGVQDAMEHISPDPLPWWEVGAEEEEEEEEEEDEKK